MSNIEWCDTTWNPVRGCSRVSPGCENCYAERQARRSDRPGGAYEGLTKMTSRGPAWTGDVRLVPELLDAPLRWRKSRRVFVNSMSDLFHEDVPDDYIDRVFAVMALAPRHTFQVLTKRAERMRSYLSSENLYERILKIADRELRSERPQLGNIGISNPNRFPPEWIWWGVSVEDQQRADERIPHLLQTPAAVRFLSCEPLLGPIDLDESVALGLRPDGKAWTDWGAPPPVDWVIVGGESGPRARPCDVAWIRSIVEQCKAAGVPMFVKQLGSHPIVRWTNRAGHSEEHAWTNQGVAPLHRKCGDPAEWPADLRVREYPR